MRGGLLLQQRNGEHNPRRLVTLVSAWRCSTPQHLAAVLPTRPEKKNSRRTGSYNTTVTNRSLQRQSFQHPPACGSLKTCLHVTRLDAVRHVRPQRAGYGRKRQQGCGSVTAVSHTLVRRAAVRLIHVSRHHTLTLPMTAARPHIPIAGRPAHFHALLR